MKNEKWVDIEGFEGKYQISTLSRVQSLDRVTISKTGKEMYFKGQILKPTIPSDGYPAVVLYGDNSKPFTFRVHQLVARTFIDNPESKTHVNHKNLKKWDNRIKNLEWTTPLENARHAVDMGRGAEYKNRSSRLEASDILEICIKLDSGEFTQMEIANQYKITKSYIHGIHVGKYWNHLTNRRGKVPNQRKKAVVNCRGEVFDTVTEAALKYKTATTIISLSCGNHKRSAGRYDDNTLIKWRYVTPESNNGI